MVADGYKQTNVGVIPTDWDVRYIKDFTDGTAGGTPSTKVPNYWGGDIRWMSSGELNYKIIFDVEGRITEEGLNNSSTKMIPENCILIGLAGQGKTRGTVAINRVELCTNQSIAAIYPNNRFISEYLFYNMEYRYEELRSMSTGDGGRGGLNLTILRNYPLAFPPKPEQQAIATALSDTDELINSLEKLISKKEAIKTGTMQELLTGKKRLDGFSGEWKVKMIKEIASIQTGSKNTQDKVTDGEYPFYVRSQTVESINSYSFDGESVLTAGDGVGVGKVFHYINGKFDYHQRVYNICNFKISGFFFYQYFKNNFFDRVMSMTAKSSVDSVRKEMISEMNIPIPPTIKEQKAIAGILSDMDIDIKALKTKLSKVKSIKEGMMQELLTGRTRLV